MYIQVSIDTSFWIIAIHNVDFKFYPFYITPIQQSLAWTWPQVNGGKFQLYAYTISELHFFYLETYVRENIITFTHSLYDNIVGKNKIWWPSRNEWSLNPDYEAYYLDPYLTIDLFGYILDRVTGSSTTTFYPKI